MATTDWNPVLRSEFEEPYWNELQAFIADERRRHTVYPPHDDVFSALHLTALADVRAVILGQDPYHGPRQAHGLAFSVRDGVQIPPSLRNIHKELHDDLGVTIPAHGNLEAWARRGVLLLNTTLTVRAGQAKSHAGQGWETFTDRVIDVVAARPEPVVFVLWGGHARTKKKRIEAAAAATEVAHAVIESAHPSPLSAHNGFLGSRPFSKVNAALAAMGHEPVDWTLPESAAASAGMSAPTTGTH